MSLVCCMHPRRPLEQVCSRGLRDLPWPGVAMATQAPACREGSAAGEASAGPAGGVTAETGVHSPGPWYPWQGWLPPSEAAEKWFCSKESLGLKDESTLDAVCSPF